MPNTAAPLFHLYGERPRHVDAAFVHVEALDERSRPNEWTIRPHSHADLNHVFLVQSGAGALTADGAHVEFKAPCLLLIPAGAVHGFEFEQESAGMVLTVAQAFLRQLQAHAPTLGNAFASVGVLDLEQGLDEPVANFERLRREVTWCAHGHEVAVEAAMLEMLVFLMRLRRAAERSRDFTLNPYAELVSAFRTLLANRTTERLTVSQFASSLGVSAARLQRACRFVAGRGPLRLAHEHRLQSAKRLLAYSTLSVGEVAYSLGIEDAAYFSRLFTRSEGISPRAYRQQLRAQMAG